MTDSGSSSVPPNPLHSQSTDVLQGLTPNQREQIFIWLRQFGLTVNELSLWRQNRQKFIKSYRCNVPDTTPEDMICRDIYELKLYAQRLVKAFKEGRSADCEKTCKQVFTLDDIKRWVQVEENIITPFKFSSKEPQNLLKSMASAPVEDVKPVFENSPSSTPMPEQPAPKMIITSVEGGVKLPEDSTILRPSISALSPAALRKTEPTNNDEDTSSSGSSHISSNQVAKTEAEENLVANDDSKDLRPSKPASSQNARTEPSACTFIEDSPEPQVNVAGNSTELARKLCPANLLISVERLDAGPALNTSMNKILPPQPTLGSRRHIDTNFKRPTIPNILRPSKTKSFQQAPRDRLRQGVAMGPPTAPAVKKRLENALEEASKKRRQQDKPPKTSPSNVFRPKHIEIPKDLQMYLTHFSISPCELLDWLLLTDEMCEWSDETLFVKADYLINLVTNVVIDLQNSSASVRRYSRLYGLREKSLERWASLPLDSFLKDKTLMKYETYQERYLPTFSDNYLDRLDVIMDEKARSSTLDFFIPTRFTQTVGDQVFLIQKVLEYYHLPGLCLQKMPCKENFHVWGREGRSRSALEMILYDIQTICESKYELMLFREVFPPDAVSFCFGEQTEETSKKTGSHRALLKTPIQEVIDCIEDVDSDELQSVWIKADPDVLLDGLAEPESVEKNDSQGSLSDSQINREPAIRATIQCLIWRYEDFKRRGTVGVPAS